MKTIVQVSIILSFLLFISSCGVTSQGNEKKELAAKYVKIERVSGTHGKDKMVFNGKMKEKSLTSLSFRVAGPLVQLNVKTGDFVRAGQVIAAIDTRDYKLQLQAKKAQYEQLKGEYTRYKELHEKNKIPANSFEKIESGYLMAKADYESAVNQLNDTKLKAPVSGYIQDKFVENFQTVGAGHPIVSIIDRSRLEAVVSVPENQILDVKECDKNYLTVKNAGVEKLPVTLLSVSEKTKNDGLYEVKFLLENTKNLPIQPGMSAEVNAYKKSHLAGISIPSSAVFFQDGSTYVWIYHDDTKTISKRGVEVKNMHTKGQMAILSGLSYNEIVVTAGVHSLYENQKVKPIQKPQASNIGGLL